MKLAAAISLGVLLCLAAEIQAQKDYSPAKIQQLTAKAEKGDSNAQCELGVCYARGMGVPKDAVEAVKWYRRAAENGNGRAQNNLGACYENGRGVTKDMAEAVKWFRKAAEQNYPPAQHNLGVCYANGTGVARDEVEAVKWYRKAAAQDLSPAQNNLGVCYAKGIGVPKDEAEAVKWFRKAAAQDYSDAQCNLGLCYANGKGVTKDEVEACKWLRLSAAQGNEHARKNLAALEKKMSSGKSQFIYVLGLIDGEHVRSFIARGGLDIVYGLLFVLWGGMMRFYPQLVWKYDFSWPGNAPLARKLRVGGAIMMICGGGFIVIRLLDLLGVK